MKPDCLYLGLGGNMAGSQSALDMALVRLSERFRFRAVSSLYLTEAQDYPNQAPFLNVVGAWELPEPLNPSDCLEIILAIESELGRTRRGAIPKGPRIIDIDILLVASLRFDLPELTVPHPRMHQRRFVLEPLLEIAPGLCEPISGEPYQAYLAACFNQGIYSKRPLKYTDVSV